MFGFIFKEQSCRPSFYTVCGLYKRYALISFSYFILQALDLMVPNPLMQSACCSHKAHDPSIVIDYALVFTRGCEK